MMINDWLNWYIEHGGDEDLHLAADEFIKFHEEHGFITYYFDGEELVVHHMAGDCKYWLKFLKNMVMSMNGLKKLKFFTKRNPQAWIRKYGHGKGRITGYEMEIDIDDIEV